MYVLKGKTKSELFLVFNLFNDIKKYLRFTEGCLYKGVMYIQDQIWNDECKYTCECQDASTGSYKCDERYV